MPSARLAAPLLVLSASLACTDPGQQPPATPPGERVASSRERVVEAAPAADLAQLVAGTTAFALDLHRALAETRDGNVFSSPQSVAFALSMSYAGAAGDTAAAFEDALRISLPEAAHHRAMNDLSRQLASRGEDARGADGPFRLRLLNQVFAQPGFPLAAPFLDVLAAEYGADARLLDFAAAPEPSREAINAWVAAATEDRIPRLLGEGSITHETLTVLVNAIYFNAAWATQFRAAETAPRPFTRLDGSTAEVPTMRAGQLPAGYAVDDAGLAVVDLPYDGGELSMLLLVPPGGAFAEFEATLTAERLAELVGSLGPATLTLSMPRFEIRTGAPLRGPLSALGLGVAFTGAADFSRMHAGGGLTITDVFHQAFVKVTETGTEAAAATAVSFGPTSAPETITVAVDRPFLFLVRDRATGAVVFLGRVVAP